MDTYLARIESASEMLDADLKKIIASATYARECLATGVRVPGSITGPDPLGHQTVSDVLRHAILLQTWVDAAGLAGVDADEVEAAYKSGSES